MNDEVIPDDDDYEVENILDKRVAKKGKVEYLEAQPGNGYIRGILVRPHE